MSISEKIIHVQDLWDEIARSPESRRSRGARFQDTHESKSREETATRHLRPAVVADDRHRKVRLHLSAVELDGDSATFTGASLGSSVKDIKAAKRDEPPVVVTGDVRLVDGVWRGSLAKG